MDEMSQSEEFVDTPLSVSDSDVLSLLMELRDEMSDHGRRDVTPEMEQKYMQGCW